jgi:hypothetical protein
MHSSSQNVPLAHMAGVGLAYYYRKKQQLVGIQVGLFCSSQCHAPKFKARIQATTMTSFFLCISAGW